MDELRCPRVEPQLQVSLQPRTGPMVVVTRASYDLVTLLEGGDRVYGGQLSCRNHPRQRVDVATNGSAPQPYGFDERGTGTQHRVKHEVPRVREPAD